MPFCSQCGTQTSGKFCPKCGALVDADAPGSAPAGSPPLGSSPRINAPGLTNNIASALCYIVPIVAGVLFLVIEPYNKERKVRFDAFQGIFLWIALFILGALLNVFDEVSGNFSVVVREVYRLAELGLIIYMAVKAYQGQSVVLPVVGPLAEKQA